jgi:hypothetical protein
MYSSVVHVFIKGVLYSFAYFIFLMQQIQVQITYDQKLFSLHFVKYSAFQNVSSISCRY